MDIGTQFTTTLQPGETQTWFTWGWPTNWFVVWSVRPTTDGEVSLQNIDVQLTTAGYTYFLTITNTGSQPAVCEAKFAIQQF